MKKANIATLRSHLSDLLAEVLEGQELEIQKRNITIAKIVPVEQIKKNKTKLGRGAGTVKFLGDITSAVMDDDWDMHK